MLLAIRARGAYGATCEEITRECPHNGRSTASARFNELRDMGAIVDSGLVRPTSTNNAATVFVEAAPGSVVLEEPPPSVYSAIRESAVGTLEALDALPYCPICNRGQGGHERTVPCGALQAALIRYGTTPKPRKPKAP